MKYRLKYFFLLIFFSFILKGQVNLVQNPSFEDTTSCPNSYKQINYAIAWDTLKSGGGGTPELFSTCSSFINISVPLNLFSFQRPKSGTNYSGLGLYASSQNVFREYIQNKLSEKLTANKTYCATLYINLANISTVGIDRIGMYFDDGSINAPNAGVSLVTPQFESPPGVFFNDTLTWNKVQGIFIASGNEEYLTIGNFHIDSQTNIITINNGASQAYYNIDDVSVVEINSKANAGQDKTICVGDSTFIGTNEEALDCQWFSNNIQIAKSAGIWVKQNTNQQYVIKQDVCGNISYDTVQVNIKDVNCNPVVNSEIPNTFTPNGDGINDVWHFSLGSDFSVNSFDVYNRWGNIISVASIASATEIRWDGYTTSGETCSDGVYFYVLKYTDAKGEVQNKKGFISLFR
jgi:gliding motility-associated-like protein